MVVSKESAYLFETRGGTIVAEFEPQELSWQWSGNEAETVDVKIPLSTPVDMARNWRNIASPWNHCIAVDVGGRYIGGPILPHDLDDDGRSLSITARGLRVALQFRSVLPVAALTTPLVSDAGVPNTALDSVFLNVDYGTIGKKVLQQACTWPSWTDVPIAYHADRPGKRMKAYPALDLVKVDTALAELSALENGPDIRLELRKNGNTFGWEYISGTEDQPRLQSESLYGWEIGKASQFKLKTDPMRMGSVGWSIGGRSADTSIVKMRYESRLIDSGGLLLEQRTAASSNESDPLLLERFNVEMLRTAAVPWEFWSFVVPADESPRPADYSPGDLVDVIVTEDHPVAGGYVPKGKYTRRIASLSGNQDRRYVTITCGENYDG